MNANKGQSVIVTPESLPSITLHLPEVELPHLVFIKPEMGKNLLVRLAQVGISGRPNLEVMAARRLLLMGNQVVPVHCNMQREKLYTQMWGIIRVLVFIGGQPHWFQLDAANKSELVIPPGHPHGIWCIEGEAGTDIVLSSQVDDVVWGPAPTSLSRTGTGSCLPYRDPRSQSQGLWYPHGP